MGLLSKLLGLTAVGTSIAKARLVQRFIQDLASVISLAIATGLMIGALLITGFYVIYHALVRYGLDPFAAEIVVVGTGAVVVVALMYLTTTRLRNLSTIPGQIIHSEFPLASHVNSMADSFIGGILNRVRR